ncbi:MAG: Lrp/AsnC family transcriptional regulator [Candidatus Nitrosopumilus sp. MTA1]|uniref:Lrp/AsnC ligand binding domain-containing protein n=1 Tax=Marine Group I thaumarchaeote TaxID=2511932 RepID=A0A7K4P688_9ARCH|nr:MAG: Lrp/AsnC family transcriptional regulator [Nitrosopumilus sp. YT1]NMI82870.1 Lrp/AsnC family transcriptional regulator [Candidatus Nitrosopumilus sp. MTA1]NWJ57401.1 Lrp/AsnC ligand binding domain-containing protein [Marine Group I thaumarchaeote]NWJ83760.1 Lrp/AsnC ligand binding domain-containing protein [Marine Group I thaumarchaeote]NWK14230.1 Lrp/AsnC ligand binding domain-containing protein [Marine Group I thaumarchaeote]
MEIAYVLLNCDLGFDEAVIEDLKHIDSVKEVHGVYGAYDIIVKVENQKRDKIREIIIWSIRKREHVRSTLSLMGIQGQN